MSATTIDVARPLEALRVPPASESRERPRGRSRVDLPELLFLIGALIAPLQLLVFASFTVYDLLLAGVAFMLYVGPRRVEPLPPMILPAAFVFLSAALVSTFRSTHPVQSLTQIAEFVFIFAVQLPVVLTLGRSAFLRRTALGLFFIGSMFAIVFAYVVQKAQGADRLLIFYSDNPNRLGYPTAYLMPFLLVFMWWTWSHGRRMLTVFIGLPTLYLLLWALAASASRSATVATLLGVLVYAVFRPGLGGWARFKRLLATGIVLAIGGVLILTTSLFPATLEERINRSFDTAGGANANLTQDRENLAEAGLKEFWSSPLVGVGFDNFQYVASKYEPSATPQAPHNIWIQFLAQIGIIGTAAFAFLMARWALIVFRGSEVASPERLRLMWSYMAAMVALMAIYLFVPLMEGRQYWLLYGLGLAAAAYEFDHAKRTRAASAEVAG